MEPLSGSVLPGPPAPLRVAALARHTELESSTPAEGAVVEGAPDGVLLRFTTPIQLPLSRVVLTDTEGRGRAGTLDMVDVSDGQELRFAPSSPLDPGRYRVEWQTAGPDSHIIRGAFAFQVAGTDRTDPGEGEGAPGQVEDTLAVAPMDDDSLEMAEQSGSSGGSGSTTYAIRWLQYLGMILVLGAVSFRFFVVPFVLRRTELAPAGALMSNRLATMAWMGIALLALSLPARLWSQSLAMWGGESLAAANLGTLVFRTPWGWGWLLQIGALIVAAVGLRVAAPGGGRKRGWGVVAVGAVVLAFVPALSGHAWGIEPRLVGVLFSGAHVLAAGVWMGGLAALLLAGLPGIRGVQTPEGERPGLVTVVEAFSRMALVAVLVLVAAGVGQNLFLLGSPGNLVSTGWGRTLLVKLGLLAAAGALGLYNWRVVRPALRETPRPGLLRIPATVEFLLGLGILAATAVLVSRALP
jgi:copper transport protein